MNLATIFTDISQAMIYVLLGTGAIWLAKKLDDYRTKDFNDDVHIDDGNLAVGLRRAGLYFALAIALSGAIAPGSMTDNILMDFLHAIADGILIILLLFVCRYINDIAMLYGISNDSECIREFTNGDTGKKTVGNTAVGIVEGAMYIATGFILRGSLTGDGGTFVQSLLSTLVFFILGQLVLLLFGLLILFRSLMDRLILPTTKLSVEIQEDQNVAALMVVESALIALAVLIASAI